jgi:hypothetical protein
LKDLLDLFQDVGSQLIRRFRCSERLGKLAFLRGAKNDSAHVWIFKTPGNCQDRLGDSYGGQRLYFCDLFIADDIFPEPLVRLAGKFIEPARRSNFQETGGSAGVRATYLDVLQNIPKETVRVISRVSTFSAVSRFSTRLGFAKPAKIINDSARLNGSNIGGVITTMSLPV